MSFSLLYTGIPRQSILRAWQRSGFTVSAVPLFSYVPLSPPKINFEEFSFAILSSRRTIDMYREQLLEAALQGISFYVVGKKTSAALQVLGVSVVASGTEGFLSLQPHLPEGEKGVFWGAEQLARPAQRYLANNPLVQHIPVYRQQDLAVQLEYSPDGIVATSPNSVEVLSRNSSFQDIPLFVLGLTSAARAKELGFSNVFCSRIPTVESLTETLLEYFCLE